MVHDEVDGNLVLSSPRHDDVRVHHRGRDVVVEGGLHVAVVLLQHAAYVSPPLADVPLQPPADEFN